MAIKQEVTQDDLAELLEGVKWHGGRYFSAYCPIEDHAKPALTVYSDSCWCLSCQKSYSLGYIYKLVTGNRQQRNPSIVEREIDSVYPPWHRWFGKFEAWDEFVKQAIENLQTFPFVGQYVYNRGISQDTIDAARLGVVDNWVVFPCFDTNNTLVDISVRHMQTKFFGIRPHKQGEPTHLFVPDWRRLNQMTRCYLPFGLFDSLTLYEAGAAVFTGISGKQVQAEQLAGINKQIVVIPDYNEYTSAVKLVRQLGWRGTLLDIPWWNYDGCKDLNDIHMKFGLEEVKKLISL